MPPTPRPSTARHIYDDQEDHNFAMAMEEERRLDDQYEFDHGFNDFDYD